MGYTTDFLGEFELDKQLDPIVGNLINGLANTRRVKRDITKLANMLNLSRQEADLRYGIEGEYYYNKKLDPYVFPEVTFQKNRPIIVTLGLLLSLIIILSYAGWYFYSINDDEFKELNKKLNV